VTTSLLIVGLVRGAAIARDVASTADLAIAGLVDLDPERLERVGDELGVPAARRHRDLERALAADADLVVLAVPTPLHRELSVAALRAGHHVLCEKPLAPSLAEARALREEVRGFAGRYMVGEQYRFADGVENLRRAIADGMVGRPAYIQHDFLRPGSAPRQTPPNSWAHDPDSAIAEMSVHHFDMWWRVTGQPTVEIRAESFNPPFNPPGRNFGHTMRATLADGTHVHYLAARALTRRQTTFYGSLTIVGEEGALSWDGEGGAVTLTRPLPSHDRRRQHLATGPVSFVERQADGASTTVVMIRELVAAIREGRPHQCDVDDNWPSFATAMAALESVRSGQPVRAEAS
jgi:predicted dehydrogenase